MFIIKLFKEKLVYELYHLYYCIFHFYYLSKLFIENKKSNSQLFWQPHQKLFTNKKVQLSGEFLYYQYCFL